MSDFPVTEYTPQWRPLMHYTPQKNWMNDPNGMVFFQGRFHLFYQYNPFGHEWGNMSWGHASSTDLINWQEHHVALEPEPEGLGYIFSGSAVVDWHNSSGFRYGDSPPLVAIFTHHSESGVQVQSLAFSNDGGKSWEKYQDNPVLDNPGLKDFRDPKVIWHQASKCWVMVLACGQHVHFYRSENLRQWTLLSVFGEDIGAHTGEWECPDLFPLIAPNGETKWVLLVSMNPGGPNNGSATQYFIGEFNGETFTPEVLPIGEFEPERIRWMDYGPDNYAGVTWDGLQQFDGRRIVMGWMSNWSYAGDLPTFPWRGAMTIPRELSLVDINGEVHLASTPAKEIIQAFRPSELGNNVYSTECTDLEIPLPGTAALKIDIAVTLKPELHISPVELTIRNAVGEYVTLRYVPARKKLVLDRRQGGWKCKLWTMPLIEAPVLINGTTLQATLILDSSSLEVFWQRGTTCMTANLFPTQPFDSACLSAASAEIVRLSVDTCSTS